MPLPNDASLFDAIEQADAGAVRRLLAERPALLEQTQEHGLTPLMLAVRCLERSPQVVQALLEGGANVNARTPEGYTALHVMIDVNGPSGTGEIPGQLARLLVDAGAEIEARQHWGWTPLMRAAIEGTPDELKALVDAGGDVNAVFPDVALPAFLRGRATSMAVVANPQKTQILIDAGADVRAVDSHGQTVLQYARDRFAEGGARPSDKDVERNVQASLAAALRGMESAGIDPDARMPGDALTYRQSAEASIREAFAGASGLDYQGNVRASIALIEKAMAGR
jgi:hypothetical protein